MLRQLIRHGESAGDLHAIARVDERAPPTITSVYLTSSAPTGSSPTRRAGLGRR